jgi:hypothetical protein
MLQLVARPRASVDAVLWDQVAHRHAEGWWFHTGTFIDYALAYTPGAVDVSQAITNPDGNRVYALMPGVELDGAPVYGGQALAAPLIADGAGLRLQPGGHPELRVAWRPGLEAHGTPQAGFHMRTCFTFVVDLRQPPADLWRGLRRSYKALIHKAGRAYDFDVYGGGDDDKAAWRMVRAHRLHVAAAGRETRALGTWQLQARWLAGGDALLVLAGRGSESVGFAYVVRWKDWAYYFSGATLEPSVSHALLWEAIQALRCDGRTRWFEVGHDAEDGDDEKARQVAFFKAGFGGQRWQVQTVCWQAGKPEATAS